MNIRGFDISLDKWVYTFIALLIVLIIRGSLRKVVRSFGESFSKFHTRTALILKYVNFLVFFILFFVLLFIWGINFEDLGLFMSSIFAVIGIAFFAQWSILSNITSGIIMFFTFPYKIGDFIKIHEGDHSIYGNIIEIGAFHTVVKSLDDEEITFPNSLMMQKAVTILNDKNIENYKIERERKKVEKEEEKQ